MKSVIAFTVALCFTVASFAQNVIDKHFSMYKDNENFTSIQVTGKMFELSGYIEIDSEDEDLAEIKDFVNTINSFNLIAGDNVENVTTAFKSAVKKVSATHEELMRIDNKDGNFAFYINERNGIVKEVVMVGRGTEELIIFSLMGDMNLRDIGQMANSIQQGGLSKLDMIGKHGVDQVKVYPNPTSAGDDITVDIPEALMGGTASITDMNGRVIKTVNIDNEQQTFSTRKLSSGNYVISLQKDEVTINRQFVVRGRS